MYSLHSAWYCQSHKPLLKNPLPQAPSSGSYILVLKEEKHPGEIWSYEQTTRPNICMPKVNIYCEIFLRWDLRTDTGGWGWTCTLEFSFLANSMCLYTNNYYLTSHSQWLQRPVVLTWLNIFSNNADVFISVRPCVFMPESDHMT